MKRDKSELPKVPAEFDAETFAMLVIANYMKPLPKEAQARVCDWATDRFKWGTLVKGINLEVIQENAKLREEIATVKRKAGVK